jgi:hypothetical protein
MKSIADALVYAAAYISLRKSGDDDADVEALESIAFMLRSATHAELDALAAAAERAISDEKGHPRREEFVRAHASWMEDLFGDGWVGNHRA